MATLIRSALDQQQYRSITNSSGAAELWFGSKHLLEDICQTFLPRVRIQSHKHNEAIWRDHYYRSLERLKAEGIATVADPEAGVEAYIEMRYQWAPLLARFVKYMAYEPCSISPAEF